MALDKNQIEAIRFLNSITEVANIIKERIEDGNPITTDELNEIVSIDNSLDTLHFTLFEGD